jgi:hypothetical protein
MIINGKTKPIEILTEREQRIKAYGKLLTHILGACAALFELVTGEKPPKLRDVLRGN